MLIRFFRKMVQDLIRQGQQMGIEVSQPICPETSVRDPNQKVLETHLACLGRKGVQIVVVIMHPDEKNLYSEYCTYEYDRVRFFAWIAMPSIDGNISKFINGKIVLINRKDFFPGNFPEERNRIKNGKTKSS